MKKFLVNVSNTIGFIVAILGIILVMVIGLPAMFVLWVATRFIVDSNGVRKYSGSEDFLTALATKIKGYSGK